MNQSVSCNEIHDEKTNFDFCNRFKFWQYFNEIQPITERFSAERKQSTKIKIHLIPGGFLD